MKQIDKHSIQIVCHKCKLVLPFRTENVHLTKEFVDQDEMIELCKAISDNQHNCIIQIKHLSNEK